MVERDRLEHYRHRYAALRPGWRPATARFEHRVATALTAESRVLDLGCGRGGIVERLGTLATWIGVDPDLVSLQQHRSASLPRGCADSERLPFASGTFDIVTASWVLEHLPHPDVTFGEIARVMRPGGSFFFLTPNVAHPLPRLSAELAHLKELQRLVVGSVYGRSADDTFPVTYRANTIEAIQRLAIRAGLRLTDVSLVEDPSYFAWNDLTFTMAVITELLLPAGCQVHVVGELRKSERQRMSKSANGGDDVSGQR